MRDPKRPWRAPERSPWKSIRGLAQMGYVIDNRDGPAVRVPRWGVAGKDRVGLKFERAFGWEWNTVPAELPSGSSAGLALHLRAPLGARASPPLLDKLGRIVRQAAACCQAAVKPWDGLPHILLSARLERFYLDAPGLSPVRPSTLPEDRRPVELTDELIEAHSEWSQAGVGAAFWRLQLLNETKWLELLIGFQDLPQDLQQVLRAPGAPRSRALASLTPSRQTWLELPPGAPVARVKAYLAYRFRKPRTGKERLTLDDMRGPL